jgi:hypothetical protein
MRSARRSPYSIYIVKPNRAFDGMQFPEKDGSLGLGVRAAAELAGEL